MKITERDWDKYAEVKLTTIPYCQSCKKGFDGPEIVFYAFDDNNIICKECAKAHSQLSIRLFLGGAC